MCVLVKVLSDRTVFDAQFERQMRRAWGVHHSTTFTMTERGLYLVHCENRRDYERVLSNGPWTYRQDLVLITECFSMEEADERTITHTEIWVQFHNLSADLLTEEGVTILADPIGEVLSEPLVSYLNGRQYFKVKILLDLAKPVKDKLKTTIPNLGDIEVFLVYEKIGRICCFCGALGHEISSCPDRARLAKIRSRLTAQKRPELESILKPTRGPWIINNTLIPFPETSEGPAENQKPIPNSKPTSAAGTKRSLNVIDMTCSFNGSGSMHLITDSSSQHTISNHF